MNIFGNSQKTFKRIKQIRKSETNRILESVKNPDEYDNIVLEINGKFYDIRFAEPLDIAEFIQLERLKK